MQSVVDSRLDEPPYLLINLALEISLECALAYAVRKSLELCILALGFEYRISNSGCDSLHERKRVLRLLLTVKLLV